MSPGDVPSAGSFVRPYLPVSLGRRAPRPSPASRHQRVWHTDRVRVYLGSDHAGFELKARLIEWLAEAGYEPVDCGPASYVQDDDYPPYVMCAAHGVASDPGSLGIVIGGSGNGEQIAAN